MAVTTRTSRFEHPREGTVPLTVPSGENELLISGASLVFYDFAALTCQVDPNKLAEIGFSPVTCGFDYFQSMFYLSDEDKNNHVRFRWNRSVRINSPHEIAPAFAGPAHIFITLLRRQFLLIETVVLIDRDQIFGLPLPITPKNALTTANVLSLIHDINVPGNENYKSIDVELRAMLDEMGRKLQTRCEMQFRHIRRHIGIQIWNISALKESARKDKWIPEGRKLAKGFAWELTALLNANSDLHRRVAAWWKDRTQEQVLSELSTGTDAVAIHRVLSNEFACLEITQIDYLPEHPDARSKQRMETYGYDSTSIFLWGYLVAQVNLLALFSRQASARLSALGLTLHVMQSDSEAGSTRTDFAKEVEDALEFRVRVYDILEDLYWISDRMKEPRHTRFVLEHQTLARGPDIRRELKVKLDELRDLTVGAAQHEAIQGLRRIIQAQTQAVSDIRTVAHAISEGERRLGFIRLLLSGVGVFIFSEFMVKALEIKVHKGFWLFLWSGVAATALLLIYLGYLVIRRLRVVVKKRYHILKSRRSRRETAT